MPIFGVTRPYALELLVTAISHRLRHPLRTVVTIAPGATILVTSPCLSPMLSILQQIAVGERGDQDYEGREPGLVAWFVRRARKPGSPWDPEV